MVVELRSRDRGGCRYLRIMIHGLTPGVQDGVALLSQIGGESGEVPTVLERHIHVRVAQVGVTLRDKATPRHWGQFPAPMLELDYSAFRNLTLRGSFMGAR